jgi:glutaminyl-tRNA synthetase
MKVNDKKVKGIIHWVSTDYSVEAEVRVYDKLFTKENPLEDKNVDFKNFVNKDSIQTYFNCKIEIIISDAKPEDRFQFERVGYFCVDMKDSSERELVFNKTLSLR